MQPPAHGWHARGRNGVLIARNYPNWTRNWWSPRWGFWFRYDPTTEDYYYYEPAVDAYVQIDWIASYQQPLETPISEPFTSPDDLSDDEPPPPIEP
jgi:hypothetical protein